MVKLAGNAVLSSDADYISGAREATNFRFAAACDCLPRSRTIAKKTVNQQKIWDHFQAKERDVFSASESRLRFIVARLVPGEAVLNVGIGGGLLEPMARAKGVIIHALDPSASAVGLLRERLGTTSGSRVQVGSAAAMPFDSGTFSCVVMSEVLEHLGDPDLAASLAEVRRVLKPGGRLLVTVPFEENLVDNIAFCPHCEHRFHRWGHVRSFDSASLRKLLVEAGYEIRCLSPRAFPDWQRRGLIGLIKSSIRYLLGRAGAAIARPSLYVEAISSKPLLVA